MEKMTQKELEEFLAGPVLARIATVGKDGSAHIAPVWFLYENGAIIISTRQGSTKIKNIENHPSVAISIDTTDGGFMNKGVIFRGKAQLVKKDALEIVKKACKKYLGTLDHPVAKMLLQTPDAVVIKLKPQITNSWDASKELKRTP